MTATSHLACGTCGSPAHTAERIAQLEQQVRTLREALARIVAADGSNGEHFIDEWTEADSFRACQIAARVALIATEK